MVTVTSIVVLVATLVVGSPLVWAWGVVRWRKQLHDVSNELPTVSVVIAGRNEERYVGTLLESILKCDYPQDQFEVVFVDDHSSDRTGNIAVEIARLSTGRLKVVHAPATPSSRSPKKSALSFGIQESSGEILLFTDADSEVHPDWIRTTVSAYDRDTGAVAGATIPKPGGGLHHRFYRLERLMAAYTSASAIGYGSPASVTGQNFSFRRRAYEEIGAYAHPEAASGDDDLMAQAIARRGWNVRFCGAPESVVTDLRPPSVPSHLAAASRHQSTIWYYPLRWRAAYLLTILAGWSLLAGIVYSAFHLHYLGIAASVLTVKILVDAVGVRRLTRQLQIRLTFFEFLLSETVLPFYLIARPMLAFRSSFDWRGRTHHRMPRPAAEIRS